MFNKDLLISSNETSILEFECGFRNKGGGISWYGIGNDVQGDIGTVIKNTYNIKFNDSGIFVAYDGLERRYYINIFKLYYLKGFIFNGKEYTSSTSSDVVKNELYPYFKKGNIISITLLYV